MKWFALPRCATAGRQRQDAKRQDAKQGQAGPLKAARTGSAAKMRNCSRARKTCCAQFEQNIYMLLSFHLSVLLITAARGINATCLCMYLCAYVNNV